MKNICPVCGYSDLKKPAYVGTYKGGSRSFEICPSCGFQYGWTDDDQHITHDQWRQKWIGDGMKWFSAGRKAPPHWDPRAQLLNIGIKA